MDIHVFRSASILHHTAFDIPIAKGTEHGREMKGNGKETETGTNHLYCIFISCMLEDKLGISLSQGNYWIV